ncbi:hypothetical protein GCM10023196_037510 [Actinoallomurus vinaceus]|uniref:Uncharacterized protein n=1 Tax=Actinoallomurus vinaceus TaxID=1080074 RepID=A0ABP8U9L3_9ACTN
MSHVPDTSHIKTWIGPYPPSRPKDTATFIWSVCQRCRWYACHREDRQSMEHTIQVWDHARTSCEDGGQRSLFALTTTVQETPR